MTRRWRLNPFRGSHLPVLMKLVQSTTGPIAELGCGTYSTQYLHWACFPTKRPLVTFENQSEYYDYLNQFARDWHQVRCIPNWTDVDLSAPWTIAFVDENPGPRCLVLAKLTHAEYVVAHDTERAGERAHNFTSIFPLFKYRWQYTEATPYTTVFSNFHDLTEFSIP